MQARRTLAASLVLVSHLLSCGPSEPAQAPTTDAEQGAPTQELDALLNLAPGDADMLLRIDLSLLRRFGLDALRRRAEQEAPALAMWHSEARERCHFDPVRSVEEAVLSWSPAADKTSATMFDQDDPLYVLRTDRPAASIAECLAMTFEGARKLTIGGVEGWQLDEDRATLGVDSWAFVGSISQLERVLERLKQRHTNGPKTLAARLAAHTDGAVVNLERARSNTNHWDISFVWAFDEGRARLRAEFGLRNAREALELKTKVDALIAEAGKAPAHKGEGQVFAAFVEGLRTEHKGSTLTLHWLAPATLTGAAASGTLAALGAYGARRYLVAAKAAEARATLQAIARALARHVADSDQKRFPASTTPVPPELPPPGGTNLSAKDWAGPTWSAIGYRLEGTTYYRFEITTAGDGRSAIVRATGDLDEDGNQARIELSVRLDENAAVVVDGDVVEVNPTE